MCDVASLRCSRGIVKFDLEVCEVSLGQENGQKQLHGNLRISEQILPENFDFAAEDAGGREPNYRFQRPVARTSGGSSFGLRLIAFGVIGLP